MPGTSSERLLRLVPRHGAWRLLIAVAGGWIATLISNQPGYLRVLIGWDAFAFLLLAMAWTAIWVCDAAETHHRASLEDPGRRLLFVLALLASTFSLFAAAVVLRQAHRLAPDRAVLWVVSCLIAVALSWLLTHTSWTLRYAHLYYRDDEEGIGGLTFPGERQPDAFDFAYFAFTIGICFQTSDIAITSPQIRRSVLFHACVSFAYTTAIIALALNLAFGFVT